MVSADKKACVSSCGTDIKINNLKTCISKDSCTLKLSIDSSTCLTNCPVG